MAELQTQSTSMEAPGSKYNYVEPDKLVKNVLDMVKWEKSETYYDLLGFINSVCMCIQGRKLNYNCQISPVVEKLLEVLDKFEKLAVDTPPIE